MSTPQTLFEKVWYQHLVVAPAAILVDPDGTPHQIPVPKLSEPAQ